MKHLLRNSRHATAGGDVGRPVVFLIFLVALLLQSLASSPRAADAAPIGNQYFERTWARTDKPVADGVLTRTWMWGPAAFSDPLSETYAEAPGGQRTVQYFDKSRMEITHDQSVPVESPWYVGNGLLARELMTGDMQTGDNQFQPREAARVNVAGDPDDTSGVTYWFMGLLQDQPSAPVGSVINKILVPGAASNLYVFSDQMAAYGITAAHYVPETGHAVARPFWDFMNSAGTVYEQGTLVHDSLFENPFYATGLPLTDAYWARVKLAGAMTDVLVQCFERRCLTYTPSNDPAWRVEAGNVGQHYHRWRYPAPQPDPMFIPGISPTEAVLYTQLIADCDEPTMGASVIGLHCNIPGALDANLLVHIYLESPSTVAFIRIMLSTPGVRDYNRIAAIAGPVFGQFAALPYEGSDPHTMAADVAANINNSGAKRVGPVVFFLNDPYWLDSPEVWDYLRVLEIVPMGLVTVESAGRPNYVQ